MNDFATNLKEIMREKNMRQIEKRLKIAKINAQTKKAGTPILKPFSRLWLNYWASRHFDDTECICGSIPLCSTIKNRVFTRFFDASTKL